MDVVAVVAASCDTATIPVRARTSSVKQRSRALLFTSDFFIPFSPVMQAHPQIFERSVHRVLEPTTSEHFSLLGQLCSIYGEISVLIFESTSSISSRVPAKRQPQSRHLLWSKNRKLGNVVLPRSRSRFRWGSFYFLELEYGG